jgi:hypothetical protein
MLISFDRTKFPLFAMEGIGIEIHLLPVTKWQFEQYVVESGWVDRPGYKKMLALNPGVSPEQFTVDQRERLFVTGILPEEAQAFARWLGQGFELPTVEEWRAVYATLRRTPLPRYDLPSEVIEGTAGIILNELSVQLNARSILDLTLMGGGLVEWVRQAESWVGLGAPRPRFHPNLWNPLDHEVRPIRLDERLPYFGFRLVRRGEWYLADRGNARFIY